MSANQENPENLENPKEEKRLISAILVKDTATGKLEKMVFEFKNQATGKLEKMVFELKKQATG